MAATDFTYVLKTDKSPAAVFRAIVNVRAWWSGYYNEEITGDTEKLHDEFSFRAGDGAHYSKHKLIEVIPDKKVVWLTTDGALSFVEKKDEWVGTKIIFEISEKDGETQLTFTHEGLTPELPCYDSCAPAWSQYLEHKLLPLINSQMTNN
ncbi:SRPBCC family protein [Flavobacterium pallidum]|uniref:ATPase n=1 Tax=Flavobacterium pallidum TaxID=2172098 RepID=A0A2S1SKX9_9FLAO|nr:SRPBCC domain-containing protein [Flavobacterium pallidum]AWI27039.1 ATPase [Flavobacterium pallidum]